jgi:hypothetical protein
MTHLVSRSGPKDSYSPPILRIYGGMASLTAGGTGAAQEVTMNPLPTRKV